MSEPDASTREKLPTPDAASGRHQGRVGTDEEGMTELLSETRILLPATQVLSGFLISLPFTQRFDRLAPHERGVYVVAFLASSAALVLLIAIAAYHRIARPLDHKPLFKVYASKVVIAALVPLAVGTAATAYVVLSMVAGALAAAMVSVLMLAVAFVLWWVAPKLRVHERQG